MHQDAVLTNYSFNKLFNTTISPRNTWKDNGPKFEEDAVTVYTDDSKTRNKVGLGLFCENTKIERSVSLRFHATIYQAQLRTIIEAAHEYIVRSYRTRIIHITSDSQATILTLTLDKFGHRSQLRSITERKWRAQSSDAHVGAGTLRSVWKRKGGRSIQARSRLAVNRPRTGERLNKK
jgi:hypothetical protein